MAAVARASKKTNGHNKLRESVHHELSQRTIHVKISAPTQCELPGLIAKGAMAKAVRWCGHGVRFICLVELETVRIAHPIEDTCRQLQYLLLSAELGGGLLLIYVVISTLRDFMRRPNIRWLY